MDHENTAVNAKTDGKSLRLLRPSLVVLCGPSACGKSTFAKQHFRPTQIISSDWARALVSDDERDQRYNTQAFALVHFLVEQRLNLNRLCVVDSTALTAQARKDLLELAKRCQVPSTIIVFNVPLETCMERDEKRERSVGRAVVERQHQAFEQAKVVILQEGFGQVLQLQDGEQDNVRIEILFRPVQRPASAETPAARRNDRPTHPPRRPANGLSGNHHPASTPPVTRPAAVQTAPSAPGANAAPKAAPPAATKTPSAVAEPRPAPPAQPASSTLKVVLPSKVVQVGGPQHMAPAPRPPVPANADK